MGPGTQKVPKSLPKQGEPTKMEVQMSPRAAPGTPYMSCPLAGSYIQGPVCVCVAFSGPSDRMQAALSSKRSVIENTSNDLCPNKRRPTTTNRKSYEQASNMEK